MGQIKWQILIADDDGNVSLHRVRKFVAILLGIAGGIMLVVAVAVEIFMQVSVPLGMVGVVGAILVSPITGGWVADSFAAARGKSIVDHSHGRVEERPSDVGQ